MSDNESDVEIDVRAIQRDDELLDALGARQPVPAFVGDDLVVDLLSTLADEVDEGVGPPLPSFQVPVRSSVIEMPRSRRVGRRTIIGLGVAGAIFSASGVAAAVTGDPLAPLKKVVIAVTDAKPGGADSDQVRKKLREAREALSNGDRDSAVAQLAAARAKAEGLDGAEAEQAMADVKALEAVLATATPGPTPLPDSALPPTPGNGEPTMTDKELRQAEKKRVREEQRQRQREERERQRQEQQNQPTPTPTPTPTPAPEPSAQENPPEDAPAGTDG